MGGLAHNAAVQTAVAPLADAAVQSSSGNVSDPGVSAQDRTVVTLTQSTPAAAAKQAGPSARISVASAMSVFKPGPAAKPFQAGVLNPARELECLAQAVYYEARGETPAGQAAVAQVVLNRVRHPAFPKSICGVVFQGARSGRGCQFSFACDGSLRLTREMGAWTRAEKIASRAFEGQVMSQVGNATHFHVTAIQPGWSNLLKVAQVGAHVFYRFGGKAGAAKAFNAEPKNEDVVAPMDAPAAPLILASSVTPAPASGEPAHAAEPAAAAKPDAPKADAAHSEPAAAPASSAVKPSAPPV